MDIGRLEFYGTTLDRNQSYFGKIYSYSDTMHYGIDDQLVFFHESHISDTSALQDNRYKGYRYKSRSPRNNAVSSPVYVAFDIGRRATSDRGASASNVMLLSEADPSELPELSSIGEPVAKRALISTFPRVFNLSTVGLALLQSHEGDSWSDLLKECWDASNEEEICAFMKSLDPDALEQVVSSLIGAGSKKRWDSKYSERVRSALAARPDAALSESIASALTSDMWVNELLVPMSDPTKRHDILTSTQPFFRAYAFDNLTDAGQPLDTDDASIFFTTIYKREDSGPLPNPIKKILKRQPDLALRQDFGGILTPDLWTDKFLGFMESPDNRRNFLAYAQPSFRAYAFSRLASVGYQFNEDDVADFIVAVRECGGEHYATESFRAILKSNPKLAFSNDVAANLTPDMWVDEFLDILESPGAQGSFLLQTDASFRACAIGKLIEAGVALKNDVFEMCPLRLCPTLLSQVRWSSDDASYVRMIGQWIDEARLHDYEGRKLIVRMAKQMYSTGELLSLAMWGQLPTAVRTRLLIFWSNHYADLEGYTVQGGIRALCVDGYRRRWDGYDRVLKACMLLFALPFSTDGRRVFLDANDALVGEIVNQFNECDVKELGSFMLGGDLQALLQRCTAPSYISQESVGGFCDGRRMSKEGNTQSVWCHAGKDRLYGRHVCQTLKSPIDSSNTNRVARPAPEDQFMADFLCNVSCAMGGSPNVGPWLDSRSEMDLVEYAYRISGYVNKMAMALPHMVCRGCGARLRLQYDYPRKNKYANGPTSRNLNLPALSGTACTCPNTDDGSTWHEGNVYIHYCLSCHKVIDSRECKIQDKSGFYLCMYCGASDEYKPAAKCPCCGNTDPYTLHYYTGSLKKELSRRTKEPRASEILVVCSAEGCNYDARKFTSEFEAD